MMDTENKRGQKIVLAIAIISILLSLLIIIVNNIVVGPDDIVQQVARLIISAILGFALYAGENWARRLTIFLYTIGGLIGIFAGIFLMLSIPIVGILLLILGIFYVTASALLLFVPDIKEHFGV